MLTALLRRGTAMKGKKNWVKAEEDVRRVLEIESNNKTAQVHSHIFHHSLADFRPLLVS